MTDFGMDWDTKKEPAHDPLGYFIRMAYGHYAKALAAEAESVRLREALEDLCDHHAEAFQRAREVLRNG